MYFITTSAIKHLPIFSIDTIPEIILDNLEFYRKKYGFKLHAYVIMPTHIHLLLWVPENISISDILRDFKKYTSVQIKQILLETDSKYLPLLMEEGKKYKNQEFKLWQPRSDKVLIESENILGIKLNYIHQNPVRKNYVQYAEEYPYSSAIDYLTEKTGDLAIDPLIL